MSTSTELDEQERALALRFRSACGAARTRSRAMGAVKRGIDLSGSAIGLLCLVVPFLLVAIAIKLDSHGPVFFVRRRVGRGGNLFPHVKFRTMVEDALNRGAGYTVSRHDPRITRVGQFLRTWSIDELPQLINVLRGDMSLVGPRPNWPHEVLAFNDAQLGKIRVRPGITGLAAIRGRNKLPWERRIEIDNWYIDNWSLVLDLKILALTPLKVVTRDGVYGTAGVNPSITQHPSPPNAEDPVEEQTDPHRA